MFFNKLKIGFTLIELLVVVSIVGLLSSVVLASLSDARESARIAKAVQELKQIETMIVLYINDTNQLPQQCSASCGPDDDPFLNSLGVSGWNGPYQAIWDREHPWGGSYSIVNYDFQGDGTIRTSIMLDDDASNTNTSDNSGIIPVSLLLKIDQQIDDGDLSTGKFVGDRRDTLHQSGGALTAENEGIYISDI